MDSCQQEDTLTAHYYSTLVLEPVAFEIACSVLALHALVVDSEPVAG